MLPKRPKLSRELQSLVRASYEGAINSIGEEEFYYIGKNFQKKLRAVENSSTDWVREVGKGASVLHELYVEHTHGELDLGEDEMARIGAALFYFVNPFDIVPDHITERGYLDDALVLDLCFGYLHKQHPDLFDQH